MHSDEQISNGEDNREAVISVTALARAIKAECDKPARDALSDDLLFDLYYLKAMRMVECRAGYVPLPDAIMATGLPVTARIYKGYSWEQLKEWVNEPNTAVIAYVPRHAVLVFAVGETSKGKHRHALIPSPSH